MIEKPARRGGWPGPARPDWQFRPHPQVQEYVEVYAARLGISRSAAINAIVTEHMRETEDPARATPAPERTDPK